ncbi:hypothetical protein L9F63_002628, partial [Diploptera punctata]
KFDLEVHQSATQGAEINLQDHQLPIQQIEGIDNDTVKIVFFFFFFFLLSPVKFAFYDLSHVNASNM